MVYPRGIAHEVSGLAASAAFDDFETNSGTGTTLSTAPITPSTTKAYLFAYLINGAFASSAITHGSGWNGGITPDPARVDSSAYRIVTISGSYNYSGTTTVSGDWGVVFAVFKAGAE